ncbi:MAG TPA: diaminopimelate decarboxylase [Clostridia bacterium]|nr:diaminopimelate decarboxylase [Clostridia bacterium]
MNNYFTEETGFYGKTTPGSLIDRYGSPLYIYNENILRNRCREMKGLVQYENFMVNYSPKANSNIELLKIIRSEGLHVDAMSPGEIVLALAAGFKPDEIFYISNNVSEEEMRFAINKGITISVDSVSQLLQYGRINPGSKVAVRFNAGIGAGHHEKVVTAGKKTKFGVFRDLIPEIKKALKEYDLKLVGINQHIGSLFMEGTSYAEGSEALMEIAKNFEDLEFIDLGGGFGVPYRKQEGEVRLDLKSLGEKIDYIIDSWTTQYGKKISFKIEPGRYISAECGVLLGTVHAIKQNYDTRYIGTDIGFNALIRPVLYNSHHEVEVYRENKIIKSVSQTATIVGNICESGDMVADNRELPDIKEKDIIGIMDAGAYCYSMASNYNCRLRPAEVLIKENGEDVLIRRRDNLEDLLRNFA